MPALKPVKLLEKLPVPVPSEGLLLAVVGLGAILQHMPLAVTELPPSDEITPPQTADVWLIELIESVVKLGVDKTPTCKVVKETVGP